MSWRCVMPLLGHKGRNGIVTPPIGPYGMGASTAYFSLEKRHRQCKGIVTRTRDIPSLMVLQFGPVV